MISNKVNLSINGIQVTADPEMTILDVARENNVFIPTLCHDDRINPFGSCLLCRIEVEGARGNMLACATKVTEGMVVRTESDGIAGARKMCLELLVSQHYGDCKAPCSMTCPAQIDIQGYIALIANGQYKEAVKLIKERNPLPLVCGRICTRPCEDQCRRNLVDERVGIDYLKRFVADLDLNSENPYRPSVRPKTGKKAAVIGAGPAGLTCAYYLSILGHDVTIFEKWSQGGGMLRYGIPEYRLPREPLYKEIELIKNLGVEIKYNTSFGKDVTYSGLKKEGYEALFLGVGSQIGQSMGLENEGLEGILSGVEFLGKVNSGEKIDFTGKKVIVIGGGNTALDAARTSLRLNALEVVLAYRRTRSEMPAHEMEVEEAEYEGVKLELLAAPKSFVSNSNKAAGVEFVRMKLGKPDASGRRRPEEIKGSEFIMDADIVIGAIGQTQDLSFLGEDLNVSTSRNRIVADKDLMTTNLDGVFAGGDAVTGPDAAISAIAAGRKAAYAMDQYLNGEELRKAPEMYNHVKGKLNEVNPAEFEGFEKVQKEKMPMLSREERLVGFREVELGLSEEQVRKEALRCLSCGCKDVNECKLREFSTTYNVQQDRLKGSIEVHPIDDTHEYITRDPNKCIMCGRCVRICMEQQGAGVLGFVERGYSTVITPSFEMPFGEDKRCEKCGQCVSTCPVGALTEKPKLVKAGPFEEKVTESICSGCGTGCSIKLNTAGDLLVRITAEAGTGINNGNLCEKGRFGFAHDSSVNRIKSPYIIEDGNKKTVTLKEALKYAAQKINGLSKEYGSSSIGVFTSPNMTNEELKVIEKLSSEAIKTDILGSLRYSEASLGLQSILGEPYGKAEYENIKKSDLIMCVGFDIKEKNPVAALFVKKAAEKGSRLVIMDNKESKLAKFASESLVMAEDEIINILTSTESQLLEQFKAASRPVLILGDETKRSVAEAAGKFVKLAVGNEESILLMHAYCNMRGMIDNGFNTEIKDLHTLKAAVIFDEDADNVLKDVPFKVIFKSNIDPDRFEGDIVIPLADFTEINGTYTSSEGHVQKIQNAFEPINRMSNIELLEEFIKELNS